MKKIFILLVLCICCVVLTACGKDEFCSHEYNQWNVESVATCEEPGVKTRKCTKCGYLDSAKIPALGHNYVDDVCTVCGKHR